MKKRRTALLDVNVLIALFEETHVHHEIAHDWFAAEGIAAWATCSITENGFLRILANPRAGVTEDRETVLASLRTFCRGRGHTFWDESVSFRDDTLFDPAVLVTHRQLTDVYLLGLAVRRKARLATFDSSIPLKAVRGATQESLALLAPA